MPQESGVKPATEIATIGAKKELAKVAGEETRLIGEVKALCQASGVTVEEATEYVGEALARIAEIKAEAKPFIDIVVKFQKAEVFNDFLEKTKPLLKQSSV